MRFFDWHQRQTEWWLDRFGMTPYTALWFAYIKGVITTLLMLWALGYFERESLPRSVGRNAPG